MPRSSLLVVAALVASACTPAATPETTPATTVPTSVTTTTLGPGEAVAAFAACLTDAGVAIDAPLGGDVSVDLSSLASSLDTTDPAVRAAVVSCSPLLSVAQAADLASDPEVSALVSEQLLAFAECMRLEGVEEFPDPAPGSSPGFDSEAVPIDDAEFDEAFETCAGLIGAVGSSG